MMAKINDVYKRLKSYEPLWDCWYLADDKMLGMGASGQVYLLKNDIMKDHMIYSVVKIITQELGPEWKSRTQEERKKALDLRKDRLLEEIRHMLKLEKRPYLVHCLNYAAKDYYDDSKMLLGFDVLIRMERYVCLGESMLEEVIKTDEIEKLARQIGIALHSMHEINMLHRDIKPGNIYIDEDTGDFLLGDFGISKQTSPSSHMTYAGTREYMAPEVFRSENSINSYTFTADIYSYGLVLYYLLNEYKLPFMETMSLNNEDKAQQLRLKGEKFPPPKNGSAVLKSVVMKCCEFRPEDRYQSMADVLADLGCEPWLSYGNGLADFGKSSDEPYGAVCANGKKARPSSGGNISGGADDYSDDAVIAKEAEEDGIDSALLTKALNGDSSAQYDIGFSYYDGSGVGQNFRKAVYWYSRAAEAGNGNALNDLGLCHENGTGVPQDDKKAVYLYTKSADSGNIYAQFNLASCCKNGFGVQKDYSMAVYWYKKACDGGLEIAKAALAELGYWK